MNLWYMYTFPDDFSLYGSIFFISVKNLNYRWLYIVFIIIVIINIVSIFTNTGKRNKYRRTREFNPNPPTLKAKILIMMLFGFKNVSHYSLSKLCFRLRVTWWYYMTRILNEALNTTQTRLLVFVSSLLQSCF